MGGTGSGAESADFSKVGISITVHRQMGVTLVLVSPPSAEIRKADSYYHLSDDYF